MISAVFDCMVFLQAVTNDRGPAFAALELVEASAVKLYVSLDILAEVQDVLSRPKLRAKFPQLTPSRVSDFTQKIALLATLMANVPDAGFAIRDTADLPYLNLAIAAAVEYLVTRDKDLLDLMQDPTFLASYPKLCIVDPATFLSIARTRSAGSL